MWYKIIFSCLTAAIACISNISGQQINNYDTTVQIRVHGNCEQCKDRIEKAVKIKGVHSGNWDIDTKILVISFNPAITSISKIKNKILAAGHDLDDAKAKDITYKGLPACCLYRPDFLPANSVESAATKTNHIDQTYLNPIKDTNFLIRGIVLESDTKGTFQPLSGASILWLNTIQGTLTDSSGFFQLIPSNKTNQLVISYTGYRSDTLSITGNNQLKIILASNHHLNEVMVVGKQQATYLSYLNPIRTQIITEKELFKAACCNLSESFETNPSVDVSYNDAITGARQIQLLGLSGIYTQLTVENLPGPRGMATLLGLNSIAGPWIESIQLTKGIGSVANGYESIAGQINVELKKPENSEQLYANAYINDFGKTDHNLNLSKKIGSNWSTAFLLHDDWNGNKKLDMNHDGFRDAPTGNQFNAINRWKYDNNKGFMTQWGFKVLWDHKIGGNIYFDPEKDQFSNRLYGLGIQTERYECFSKTGYVFPKKKYKSIGLQISLVSHDQSTYMGLNSYDAHQNSLYGNLIYQSIINSTQHKFRTGISFSNDHYTETYNNRTFIRTETVPGAFFEYTFTPSEKVSLITVIRADHHNLFGFFFTPRINLRYEPVKGTTIRLSAGRGQRTANILAENMGNLISARQLQIITNETGKAYGLNPEIAWNKGISIDQRLKLFSRNASLSVDFFRNDFQNQVNIDLENPRYIKFYNIESKSYSNSLQIELSAEPVKNLDIKLAYRYFDVKTLYANVWLERPLIAANRAFTSLDYHYKGWKWDYTINYNGSKRLPYTGSNPQEYQRPDYSPAFISMNAQMSKTMGKKHPMDFYFGAENLTGYTQPNPIIAANQPFGQYFDASMIWGPISGAMFYVGWRFKLK